MSEPKVLLFTLSVRKSARSGKSYLTGFLGRSRLIDFQSPEHDKFGNLQFDLFVQAIEERRDERPARELVAVNGNHPEEQAR